MKINIQFEKTGREVELGSRLAKYFKWIWLVLFLWAATTAASLYIITRIDPLSFVDLELQLQKNLLVKIDSTIPVKARLDQVLVLPVKKMVSAEVFVDQTFSIPVNEEISVPLNLKVDVPLDQEIYVRTEVPLRTEIPVDTNIYARMPMIGEVSIPVRGTIPVDLLVPVNGIFHVKANVPISLDQIVTLPVHKTINAPLKATVKGDINLDTSFEVPVSTEIDAEVMIKDMVKGEIDQTLVLDRDILKIKANPERTKEMKQEIFSKLPEQVREKVEQSLPEE